MYDKNEIQKLLNRIYDLEQLNIDDTRYLLIALNLSGNAEKYLDEAMKLIDKIGIKKALRESGYFR